MKHLHSLVLILLFSAVTSIPLSSQDIAGQVKTYLSGSAVRSAFVSLEQAHAELKKDWKSLARIYAPSGQETPRAEYLVQRFQSMDLEETSIDAHGNAIGVIRGAGDGPAIAFLGTMDDLATVAEMVREWDKPILEEDGRMIGPGTNISATCISILGLARMFTLPQIQFHGTIYLVGVVQEETGLTGIKGFLDDHPGQIDYVVDIMAGAGSVSYGAIGIHWFKIHFTGERGHTLGGGLPNVTRGVARAVDQVFAIPVPQEPPEKKSFLNVAMLGAGTVYNHRSEDAWFSVDLRSMDNATLLSLKDEIFHITESVASEEGLGWRVEPYSEVPAGQLPGARDSRLVRIAEEAIKALGYKASLSNRGSSNMNVGIARNIRSISLGGDRGGGRDSLNEYANITPVLDGVKVQFLLGYMLLNGAID